MKKFIGFRGNESSIRSFLIRYAREIFGDRIPISQLPPEVRRAIRESTDVCFWCGRDISGRAGSPVAIDHFIPRRRGGRTIAENLMKICKDCNNKKSFLDPEYFALKTGCPEKISVVRQKKLELIEKCGIPLSRYRDQFFVEKFWHDYRWHLYVLYVYIDSIPEMRDIFHSLPPRTAFFVKFKNGGLSVKAWCTYPEFEDEADKKLKNVDRVKLIF